MRRAGAFFICCLLITACNGPADDVFAPEILRFNIEDQDIVAGDDLIIDIKTEDDVELNQLRFRVREAFAKSSVHWSLVSIVDLSGRIHEQVYSFPVPDSVLAGMYEVALQVVDERGNATIDSLRTFFILQAGLQPVFQNVESTPPASANGSISLMLSDSVRFTGQIEDSFGLSQVRIEVKGARNSNLQVMNYAISDTLLLTSWDIGENAAAIGFPNSEQLPLAVVIKALNLAGHQSRVTYTLSFFQ